MLIWTILIFYWFTTLESTTAMCSVNVSNIDSKSPIILQKNDILHTENENNLLTLRHGEKIELLCSGRRNSFSNHRKLFHVKCLNGRFLLTNNTQINIETIKCRSQSGGQTKEVGLCNQENKRIQIGFQIPYKAKFLPKIELCFDHVTQTTFWTKHELHPTAPFLCNSSSIFIKSSVFERENVHSSYAKYPDYNTGFLTPKCDFYTPAEQKMTSYYINSAPQNAKFNRANWKSLETEIRKAAKDHKEKFYIYTGTTNTIEYMAADKIPISLFFWKVVISKSSGNGVAFVGVNSDKGNEIANPCPVRNVTDMCDSLEWLSASFKSNAKLVDKGRIFCCPITEFKKMPHLKFPTFLEYVGTLLTTF